MLIPNRILFVCHAQRPPVVGESCGSKGAAEFLQKLREILQAKMLWGPVMATASGCLGTCDQGPWAVVYPDNVWYRGLTPEDAQEIVEEHLEHGRVVERLAFTPPDSGETSQGGNGFEV